MLPDLWYSVNMERLVSAFAAMCARTHEIRLKETKQMGRGNRPHYREYAGHLPEAEQQGKKWK